MLYALRLSSALTLTVSTLLLASCQPECKDGYGLANDGVCYPIDMGGDDSASPTGGDDGDGGGTAGDGAGTAGDGGGTAGDGGGSAGDGGSGNGSGTAGDGGGDGGGGGTAGDGGGDGGGGGTAADGGGGDDGGGSGGGSIGDAASCDDACALAADCELILWDDFDSCLTACSSAADGGAAMIECVDAADDCPGVQDNCADLF